MAYQFIHVECYARRASTKQPNAKKGKAGKVRAIKLTAAEVAAEADRQPDATPHIAKPLEPVIVFGSKVADVVAEAERRAQDSTDSQGRKVRADTSILLAGVASHHFTPGEVEADPAKRREYEQWRKLTIEHLQKKYGGALKSVVEHRDESHMHVHFYAIPEAGQGFNAKDLHDGFVAGKPAKDAKEQKRLYTEAMRQLQDDYFREVGAKCGQARTGPRRERLTRADWMQRQREVQQLSRLMRAGRVELAKARKMAAQIIENAKAKARKPGELWGSFMDGITGRSARLRREHDERVAKERQEAEKAKKVAEEARKQVDELQKKVAHERLKSDQTVDNLVALKTQPLERRAKLAEEKAEERGQQLDQVTAENKELRQMLDQLGVSMGAGKPEIARR